MSEDVLDHTTGNVIACAHELITEDLILTLKMAGIERVQIRSAFTCQTTVGICAYCYGTDLSNGKLPMVGTAVGIIVAQSIGSAISQYVMDAWKKEGNPAAWLKEVEDLFEARKPGEKPEKKETGDEEEAEEDWISEMANLFGNEEDDEFNFEEEQAGGDKPLPYDSEEATSASVGEALVASSNPETIQEQGGDKPLPYDADVEEQGDDFESEECRGGSCGLPLEQEELECLEGTSPSPTTSIHEIVEKHGMKAAQLYLMGALQRLYDGAGITINDKHFEVIIRKMSEMVEIKEPWDADFLVGQVVKKPVFYEVNAHVTFSGGRAAVGKEIIHGTTKASKLTDSWIAAATFQDTTKALTNAAIAGKIDNLNGMCENVILGRLIPAGTGFKKA